MVPNKKTRKLLELKNYVTVLTKQQSYILSEIIKTDKNFCIF